MTAGRAEGHGGAHHRACAKQLLQALKEVGVPGTWDHVVHQIGMFSFLGVSKVAHPQLLSGAPLHGYG